MEKCLAILLLIILTPILLIISLVVLIANGRPVFFVQKRIGKDGKTFKCYKFRSMIKDAYNQKIKWQKDNPELWAEYEKNNFKLKNDYRVTKTGKLLRKTSLDELPQIFNIIKGEMSFIGPRPILLREKRYYGKSFKSYIKHKPGVTGLWQVNGRSNTSFKHRIKYDRLYSIKKSPALNLYILLKTFWVTIIGQGSY